MVVVQCLAGRVSGMTDLADLALAHRLADQADEIARRYFRAPGLGTEEKGDGSPVTEADREIERALRASIHAEHPGDAFVGEEFGARGSSSRRWIIDAIDGTASCIAGDTEALGHCRSDPHRRGSRRHLQ